MKTRRLIRLLLLLVIGFAPAGSSGAGEPPLAPQLTAGDHTRRITSGGRKRTCLVHIPPNYDPATPVPVVLALHGAGMNGAMMAWFTGLNQASDKAGFIVAYPSGTGVGPFLTWNAGGFTGQTAARQPDDVVFIGAVLDDLRAFANVDAKRVYACGMSNGGMMCYRLAAELSDRIAAIAPVAGTIAIGESKPKRPVSVLHFHGTGDTIVPYEARKRGSSGFMKFKGVEESVQTWVKLNQCAETPKSEVLTGEGARLKVTRKSYTGGKDGSEVILVTIGGGGHTWPGRKPPVGFLGESTRDISANDLIWEFFQRHRLE